jgi:DNA-directed RNA polymerase subunit M/transcription elongation factor TFIIS
MSRIISNPDQFRKNVSDRLSEIVKDDTIGINMEKAVYNYAIREAGHKKIIKKWANPSFSQMYVDHLRTVFLNMKNDVILSQIISKELAPHTYVFMTHQEMKPERWTELLEKKNIIDANKYTNNVEASTDLFTCPAPKCRSRRCTYYTLQVRSADEPESVFVTCLDCGKNFRRG